MDVKEVISILENAPRRGRPEFNQTVELDTYVVNDMIAALKKPKAVVKRTKVVGAEPQ